MTSVLTTKLIQMLKGDIPKVVCDIEWEYIVRVARDASMLARFSYLLKSKRNSHFPEYLSVHLDAALRPADLLSQQMKSEVDGLIDLVIDCSNVPIVFLKGAAYGLAGYEVGKGRTFSDIDLLVPKSDLIKIEKKFLLYGWIADDTDEYNQMYYRNWAHEIPPLVHCTRHTLLDVHHNLIPPVSGKAPDISLFTSDLIDVCDGRAKVLSHHAMTLHSAIHLFYQEEYHHGFRDIADLHLMFCEFGDANEYWQKLFDLAEKSCFTLELALACRYTQYFFDTPIPKPWSEKANSLLPNKFKLILLDWMFIRVLQPHHPLCKIKFLGIANFIAMLRGHWIKMPLHILIRHTATKAYKSLVNIIAGKGALKKGSDNNPL